MSTMHGSFPREDFDEEHAHLAETDPHTVAVRVRLHIGCFKSQLRRTLALKPLLEEASQIAAGGRLKGTGKVQPGGALKLLPTPEALQTIRERFAANAALQHVKQHGRLVVSDDLIGTVVPGTKTKKGLVPPGRQGGIVSKPACPHVALPLRPTRRGKRIVGHIGR